MKENVSGCFFLNTVHNRSMVMTQTA